METVTIFTLVLLCIMLVVNIITSISFMVFNYQLDAAINDYDEPLVLSSISYIRYPAIALASMFCVLFIISLGMLKLWKKY